ncbi:hypothetical protein [Chelatococcus sp. CO-6]|uniref:hypothetical protein n=1 Tax=Chelatococcus sp. CO-6 TaxID=1702325 RepID=UPI001FD9A3EC|nr:hypothetical protein [Chelatococcus sp. CO-6]
MSRAKRDLPWVDTRGGVYYVLWSVSSVDAAGRKRTSVERLSLRTRDPDEAQTRFAAFLAEGQDVLRPAAERRGNAGLTIKQALDDYWREHVNALDDRGRPNVADPTRQENAIRHLKAFFKEDLVTDIDIPKCRAYTAAAGQGRSAAASGARTRRAATAPFGASW